MDAPLVDGRKPYVFSFGGGVQTTAMVAMAANGLIRKPDFCVFADPGDESKDTYDYIKFFKGWMEKRGITLIVRDNGIRLSEKCLKKSEKGATVVPIPVFTIDGEGNKGMMSRHCTYDFKVKVVIKAIREEFGATNKPLPSDCVDVALGISTDEISRMKESRVNFVKNVFPLISEKATTRQGCLDYIKSAGLPQPPKSSCIFCPFKTSSQWLDMKRNKKDEWDASVELERKMRENFASTRDKMTGDIFFHQQLVPLEEVDLEEDQLDFFNDCEGHCGL